MDFAPIFVQGTDLGDTWFTLIYQLKKHGRKYYIDEGSYAGQYRLAFDFVSGAVMFPHKRPLAPIIPESSSLPPPTTDHDIEQYFANYLMNSELEVNEDYRYATWIVGGEYEAPFVGKRIIPNMVEWLIKHFCEKGWGNEHGYINIGCCESNYAYDIPYKNENERRTSPCLRGLDFRIIDETLTTHVVYRCLKGDTPVLIRENGSILRSDFEYMYKQFKNGSSIEIYAEVGNNDGFTSVSDVHKNYREDIFRIEFSNYSGIDLSPNHKVFIERDDQEIEIRADEVRLGDYFLEPLSTDLDLNSKDEFDILSLLDSYKQNLFVDLDLEDFSLLRHEGFNISSNGTHDRSRKVDKIPEHFIRDNEKKIRYSRSRRLYDPSFEIDEDLSFFFGLWMSDGWFGSSLTVRIVVSDLKYSLREWLENFIKNKLNLSISSERRSNCTVYNLSDPIFRLVMESLGFFHGSTKRSVPDFIFNLSLSKRKTFIEGWLAGDGGTTCSKELAFDFIYLSKISGTNFSFSGEPPKEVVFHEIEGDRIVKSSYCYHLKKNSSNTSFSNRGISRHNGRYYRKKVKRISNILQACETFDISVKNNTRSFYCGAVPVKVHNSWDLVGGWPTNMGGFTLLNEYVAQEVGVEPGPLTFSCKSLHAYDHAFEYLNQRVGK